MLGGWCAGGEVWEREEQLLIPKPLTIMGLSQDGERPGLFLHFLICNGEQEFTVERDDDDTLFRIEKELCSLEGLELAAVDRQVVFRSRRDDFANFDYSRFLGRLNIEASRLQTAAD